MAQSKHLSAKNNSAKGSLRVLAHLLSYPGPTLRAHGLEIVVNRGHN